MDPIFAKIEQQSTLLGQDAGVPHARQGGLAGSD